MSYNFLGLVNDVNQRLNEVELTEANFASAIGFYASAKNAVNWSINYINQQEFEWPFNHVTQTQVMTIGQSRYEFPVDKKVVGWKSFLFPNNSDGASGHPTRRLYQLDYEEYLDKYSDAEFNTSNTSIRSLPTHVVRTPDAQYLLYPPPDKEYTLNYEYYTLPVQLVGATDVPSLPEMFRNIINEGAMVQAYLFRGDKDGAMISQSNFLQGLKNMKGMYINRYEYARSTMVT